MMRLLSVLLTLAIAGCGPAEQARPPAASDSFDAESTGGDTVIILRPSERLAAVIRDSQKITAVLTAHGQIHSDAPPDSPAIYSFANVWHAIRSPIVTVDRAKAQRLRAVLLAVRNGPPGIPTDCTFAPDIAYHFATVADSATVLVCHTCGEARSSDSAQESGSQLAAHSDSLLTLSEELFPGDAELAQRRRERSGIPPP